MNAKRLGRAHRAIRQRQGMRQQDVADAAGLPRTKVSRLENEKLAKLSVPEIERCFAALGATITVGVHWQGAELDRLLDEAHALLVGHVAAELRRLGWEVRLEVSFSEFGERGSIDILAWKAAERALLVCEVKSEIAGMDRTLRPLDVKVRLAPKVAAERFGWEDAAVVGRVVVLPETSTARRTRARHADVLDMALPGTSRHVRRWLAMPRGSLAGIWFLSAAQTVNAMKNPSSIRRVRRRKRTAS